MRALRPDRMTYAVQGFIQEKLGPKFVESRDPASSFPMKVSQWTKG